jgi:hypothetical protein
VEQIAETAGPSTALRSGRDDKGRAELPARFDAGGENCRSLGFARDDKGKGRAHLSSHYRGWAEPQLIRDFHPLWGRAHDSFGRDDNSVGELTLSFPNRIVIPTEAQRSGGTCGLIFRFI